MARIPTPPQKLDRLQRRIYRELWQHLQEVDAARTVDKFLIHMTATCLARYLEAERMVAEKGPIQTFKNGTTNVSTEYVVMRQERNAYLDLCRQLGLSPYTREKIMAFAKDEFKESDAYFEWAQRVGAAASSASSSST